MPKEEPSPGLSVTSSSLTAAHLVPGHLPENSLLLTKSISPGMFVHPCSWLVEAALSSDAERSQTRNSGFVSWHWFSHTEHYVQLW